MNEIDIITLTDVDGEEVDFYLDASFELDDDLYVVLTEVEENEEEISVILRVVEDNDDEMVFEGIEDEKELEQLIDVYLELEENIGDDE